MLLNLTINGKNYAVEKGLTILEAAKKEKVPRFCPEAGVDFLLLLGGEKFGYRRLPAAVFFDFHPGQPLGAELDGKFGQIVKLLAGE